MLEGLTGITKSSYTGDDLISRQGTVNEIHKYFVEEIDKTPVAKDEDGDEVYTDMPTVNSLLACNKELSKRIKALPSADRPTGEWVKALDGCERHVKCTHCFKTYDWHSEAKHYNYCPNCGCEMNGGSNVDE